MVTNQEAQTKTLLSHLWRGAGWAYWWTPDGPEYYSKKSQETRNEKVSLWFPLNRRLPAIPAAWQACNVYFGVHPTTNSGKRWQRARLSTIASINAVFAEFDVKDYGSKPAIWAHLETLPLFPTCVIDSGGGLHCYWLIRDVLSVTDDNRAYVRQCQAAWVELAGGDVGAKDLARVLRLPGSQNRKPEHGPVFPTVGIVEFNAQRLFPFSRIQTLVEDRIVQNFTNDRHRREHDAAHSFDVASGAAEVLLEWAVRNAKTGSRHRLALWLAGRLKAEGLAQWVATSILREFARQVSPLGAHVLDASEMDKIVSYVWGTS